MRRVTCRRSARVRLVRHPDLRQEAACVQPRQHGRVNDIGLDARLGDQTHLARIGDRDPTDMGPDHLRYRCRVAGRFDDDVVVTPQLSGECRKMLARHPDAAEPDGSAVVEHHGLGEHAVDVQAYDPHGSVSYCLRFTSQELAGNTATTDPRSRRIRASRRGGQIKARAHGPWFKGRPARTCVLPVPLSRMVAP